MMSEEDLPKESVSTDAREMLEIVKAFWNLIFSLDRSLTSLER